MEHNRLAIMRMKLAIILLLVLAGCGSVSITVAEKCAIVQHTFWTFRYWSDIKCMSEEEYRRAHESPPKIILEELLEGV
jgi:hypothetical protein